MNKVNQAFSYRAKAFTIYGAAFVSNGKFSKSRFAATSTLLDKAQYTVY